MHSVMKPYIDLGKEILKEGDSCEDRTGAGTWSVFGRMLEFDVRKGAPILTERKIPIRSVAGELLWFLEGSTNADVLREDYKCNFWDEWASDVTKTIGPMYGKQWRNAGGVDQLAAMLEQAIKSPDSRRLLVSTWIPELIPNGSGAPKDNPEKGLMSLAPCHYSYQIRLYTMHDIMGEETFRYVDLMFNLRSSDYFIGLPNNIASYYMLQELIAEYLTTETGVPHYSRHLKVSLGDVHIYKNHDDACIELFEREPSDVVPRMDVEELTGILKYMLTYSPKGKFAHPIVRGKLLKRLRSAVKDYEPQASIKADRNI